jgi:hypothetical protein
MTDLRNERAAGHNRGHTDAVFLYGPAVPTAAIAGGKAMVILDGSHSVKAIHPASSTGSCWIPYRLNSHAGPTV